MFHTGAAIPRSKYEFGPLAPERRERGLYAISEEDLGRLTIDPSPTLVGAIVYSLWLAIVGLIVALFTGSSPWQEIGFAMVVVFGACAATGLAHALPRAVRAHRRERLSGRT
jgi:hypothetical protein